MTFDDEANSWLAPFSCVTRFKVLIVEPSRDRAVALALFGPLENQLCTHRRREG